MIPTTAPSPLNPWLNPCLVPQEDKQEQHLGIIDSYSSPRCQSGIISLHIASVCHTLYTSACCRYRIQSSSKTNQLNPRAGKNFPVDSREKKKKKKKCKELLLAASLQWRVTLAQLTSSWRFCFKNTTFAHFYLSECYCLVCVGRFTGSVLHRCWFTQEMAHAAWLGWSRETEA